MLITLKTSIESHHRYRLQPLQFWSKMFNSI